MDLKKRLGKKYKDNMTFEEIQEALADLPEPDSPTNPNVSPSYI